MADEEVTGTALGAAQGALAGAPLGPVGVVVGGLIGLAGGLFGSSSKKKAAKKQRRAEEAALRQRTKFARKGFDLQREVLRTGAFREAEKFELESEQDKRFTRLKGIAVQQQAAIIAGRQRTAAQAARISGFGGSFAQERAGVSELRTNVERQLDQLRTEKGARQEQRNFEAKSFRLFHKLELRKTVLQRQATTAGAQVELDNIRARAEAVRISADIDLVQDVIGIVGNVATRPSVESAIKKFFGSDGGT